MRTQDRQGGTLIAYWDEFRPQIPSKSVYNPSFLCWWWL